MRKIFLIHFFYIANFRAIVVNIALVATQIFTNAIAPIKFAKLGNICDMPATLPAFRAIKAHFIFDFLVRKFRQIVLTPLAVNLALIRLFRLKVVYRAQF